MGVFQQPAEVPLTLSGGFDHEAGNTLFELLTPALWALCLSGVMLLYAQDRRKRLVAFCTAILIARHSSSLLQRYK